MGLGETLKLVVQADVGGAVHALDDVGRAAQRSLPKAQKDLDRLGHQMVSLGTIAVGAGVAIGAGMLNAGQAASDLNEVASKSRTVFGSAADSVEAFAESAQNIGLSKRAALEAASGFGNLFDQVGFASGAAATMSTRMTALAADFASFHNADITQVLEAQSAAFRGEYDSIQRFVPTLTAAAVQQRALADTGKDSAASLTAGEKAAATYALIIEGAGQATGDFARTSDSAANQQRQFTAAVENMRAELGQAALPVMQTFLGVATDAVGAFSGLNKATGGLVGQLAAFGAIGLIVAGGASILIGKLVLMRDTLTGLGPRARLAVTGLAAVGATLTAISIITGQREQRSKSWIDDQIGDIDTSKLTGVRDAIKETKAALDELDDEEGKHRLFSFRGTDVFATGGDADRNERIKATREQLAELEAQEKALTGAQNDQAAAFVGGAAAVGEFNQATSDTITALSEVEDKIRAQFDPLFGMMDALQGNREALTAVDEAQTAYNEAVAQYGATSPEATAAAQALTDAQNAATRSALDVTGATAQMNAAIEANPGLLADSKAQLATWVAQGLITQATADSMAAQFDVTAARAVALGRTDPTIDVSATGIPSTISALEAVTNKVNEVPKAATIRIGFEVYGQAELNRANALTGRQHGGPVTAGRAYVVGEHRPELFIPDVDGTIMPTVPAPASTVAWGGGGMGGGTYAPTYNITVAAGIGDKHTIASAVAEAVRYYDRLNGRQWREGP